MWGKIQDHLVDDIHCAWRWATTWLNIIGSTLVTLALTNEQVVHDLLPFLPDKYKPYAPVLGILWGGLVQTMRSVKQKQPNAPSA